VGVDLGWSHRSYSKLDAINDSNRSAPFDYGLGLSSYSADNLVVSPVLGLEWVVGDHYSLSLMPRFEFLVGKDRTWAFTAPLTFSWSWFL
jgi:hypothetical protein